MADLEDSLAIARQHIAEDHIEKAIAELGLIPSTPDSNQTLASLLNSYASDVQPGRTTQSADDYRIWENICTTLMSHEGEERNPVAVKSLAKALRKLEKKEELKALEGKIGELPDGIEKSVAYYHLSYAYADTDKEKQVALLREANRISPEDFTLATTLVEAMEAADMLKHQKNLAEARGVLEQLPEIPKGYHLNHAIEELDRKRAYSTAAALCASAAPRTVGDARGHMYDHWAKVLRDHAKIKPEKFADLKELAGEIWGLPDSRSKGMALFNLSYAYSNMNPDESARDPQENLRCLMAAFQLTKDSDIGHTLFKELKREGALADARGLLDSLPDKFYGPDDGSGSRNQQSLLSLARTYREFRTSAGYQAAADICFGLLDEWPANRTNIEKDLLKIAEDCADFGTPAGFNAALAICRRLPDNSKALSHEVEFMQRSEDYKAMLGPELELERRIEKLEDSEDKASCLYGLALAYRTEENYQKSSDLLEQALTMRPTHPATYYALANSYCSEALRLHDGTEAGNAAALAMLDRAFGVISSPELETSDSTINIMGSISERYFQFGAPESAVNAAFHAYTKSPDNSLVFCRLMKALKRADMHDSILPFDADIRKLPEVNTGDKALKAEAMIALYSAYGDSPNDRAAKAVLSAKIDELRRPPNPASLPDAPDASAIEVDVTGPNIFQPPRPTPPRRPPGSGSPSSVPPRRT